MSAQTHSPAPSAPNTAPIGLSAAISNGGTPSPAGMTAVIPRRDRRFPLACFAQRRERVLDAMRAAGGGVAIIAAAPAARRSRDTEHPYRQDSNFFYLTGFDEPEALLVLDTRGQGTAAAPTALLFCREKQPEREIWEGFHYGPEAAAATFGLDLALPNGERDSRVCTLLTDTPRVYYPLFAESILDTALQGWLGTVRARRGVKAPSELIDLAPLVERCRAIKDSHELERMRAAARISAQAHIRAMQAARPGVSEYAIEAELLYTFRHFGAQAPAYTSIVAAGENACVLHYPAGDKILADGDLVLIDAACELDGYASDITRTFPANGRYSGPQRTLYDIVLEANRAAAAATRPGARFDDAHDAALRVLVQGMLDTGLLRRDKHGSVDDAIAERAYTRFYMHRTGHWLGMDVHDCGDYTEPGHTAAAPGSSRVLQAGMVLTIEPGLYVRPADDVPADFWNIGIRTEDDAVVTPGGCELITRDVPVEAGEIEALMRQGR